MIDKDKLNNPGEIEDRLGHLIRQAYRIPEKDHELSIDLTTRILSRLDEKPTRISWYEHLISFFQVTPRWVPAGALACLLIGVGAFFFMSNPTEKPTLDSKVATIRSSTNNEEQDPLGSDFFTFEKYDDEPITVDLADGWDAMTIEDEGSNTALVYFYSAGEVKNSTGGIQ